MLIMGVATFLIGVIPTHAAIGMTAPILLVALRLAQGIAVGGEWGGAVLMAVEYGVPLVTERIWSLLVGRAVSKCKVGRGVIGGCVVQQQFPRLRGCGRRSVGRC
jgi:MFS family permease